MTLEQHQAEFLSGCQDGTEYCQCRWEQFSTLFTAAEMDADTVPDRDARMAELKKRVGQNCAKKLPEPRLKEMIVSSCADDPKFRPFCECLFTEQRKKEPITVFLDAAAAKTPEAEAIRRAAGKQCSPTVPEAFQQQIFVNACKKDKDALQPFCGCLWKTARAHLSTGEIGAGFLEVDQAKLEPLIEKSCGKLRPAK